MDNPSKETSLFSLRLENQKQTYQDHFEVKPILDQEPNALAAVTPNAHSKGISLLTLPTEIRHKIYGYVFGGRYIKSSFWDPSCVEKGGIALIKNLQSSS